MFSSWVKEIAIESLVDGCALIYVQVVMNKELLLIRCLRKVLPDPYSHFKTHSKLPTTIGYDRNAIVEVLDDYESRQAKKSFPRFSAAFLYSL